MTDTSFGLNAPLVRHAEVKASATVHSKDFKGLKRLQETLGDDFTCGVVLYDGDTLLPFGDRLCAAPMSLLWR
jgi:uncharacterized protein